jgi:hypothetical protein
VFTYENPKDWNDENYRIGLSTVHPGQNVWTEDKIAFRVNSSLLSSLQRALAR